VRVSRSAEPNAHINPAGEDVKAGSVLVPAGRRLAAAEMGILATAGFGSVPAYPKLRVGVLSIGTLVEPGRSAGFGEVRDATSYLLLGALRDVGAVPYRIGIVVDPRAHLRETVMSNTLRADAFVAAGGQLEDGEASVPGVLSGLGDVRTVHVAAHPVSALGFGTVEGKPFFCVSGKPMSALVSFEILVRQAILKMMGRRDLRRPEVSAVLDEPVAGPRDVALFVPARMTHGEGGWHARPTGPVAEGLLGAAVEANALVALPAGERPVPGAQVRVQVVRPLER
jgi:molybdopterin molybdotransferase